MFFSFPRLFHLFLFIFCYAGAVHHVLRRVEGGRRLLSRQADRQVHRPLGWDIRHRHPCRHHEHRLHSGKNSKFQMSNFIFWRPSRHTCCCAGISCCCTGKKLLCCFPALGISWAEPREGCQAGFEPGVAGQQPGALNTYCGHAATHFATPITI